MKTTSDLLKLTERDRIRITPDGAWIQVTSAPGDNGWFNTSLSNVATTHVTSVVKTLCHKGREGCQQFYHCEACDGCPGEGGPYGCHCECSQQDEDGNDHHPCVWCAPADYDEWTDR